MKHIAVATACIRQDGKTLLLCRSAYNKHFRGTWQLPEGKLEKGESAAEALVRELREELQCDPSSIHLLGHVKTSILLEGNEVEVKRSIFHVTLRNAIIRLSHEHDDLKWVDAASLQDLLLYPGTLDVLEMGKQP